MSLINDPKSDREAIFLSGIDQSIKESDIKELFSKVVRSEPYIRFHYFSVLNKPHIIVEVLLPANEALLAHQHLNNTRLKGLFINLIPKNSMKALIITNIPAIISEKDLFLIVARMTPGLKRIMIADDPEVCGKTLGLAVAIYQTHENARDAIEIFRNNNKILGKPVSAVWKEPSYDIIGELAFDTRVLYIKNISIETTVERLKEILSKFGKVIRVKKFADKAFVEFDDIRCARKAMEVCQEKKFDGMNWRIFPSKKFDEEKAKENPDRNVIYSKSFLEEIDQQILLKFMYDASLPEVNPQIMQKAASVIDAAKNFQRASLDHLRQQYEILSTLQNAAVGQPQPHDNVQAPVNVAANPVEGAVQAVEEQNTVQIQIKQQGMSKTQMRKLQKQKKANKKHHQQNQGQGQGQGQGKGPNNNAKEAQLEAGHNLNLSFGEGQSKQGLGGLSYENAAALMQKGLGGTTPNSNMQNGYNVGVTGSMSPFARNVGNGQNLIQGFQSKF